MTEGTVMNGTKVGDTISEGDLLAEIKTDKAITEFESFQEGVLLHIGVEEVAQLLLIALAVLEKKVRMSLRLLKRNRVQLLKRHLRKQHQSLLKKLLLKRLRLLLHLLL